MSKRLQAERGPSTAIFTPEGTSKGAGAEALVRAADAGDAPALRSLLAAGGNARYRDGDGVTLVMRAAASGNPEAVRAVLVAGGDPTARDNQGRNAADRVRDRAAQETSGASVGAAAHAQDYAQILRLLTDEQPD